MSVPVVHSFSFCCVHIRLLSKLNVYFAMPFCPFYLPVCLRLRLALHVPVGSCSMTAFSAVSVVGKRSTQLQLLQPYCKERATNWLYSFLSIHLHSLKAA